jgi:hypothetical protein
MNANNPEMYQPPSAKDMETAQEQTDDDSVSDHTKDQLHDAFMHLEMVLMWTSGRS